MAATVSCEMHGTLSWSKTEKPPPRCWQPGGRESWRVTRSPPAATQNPKDKRQKWNSMLGCFNSNNFGFYPFSILLNWFGSQLGEEMFCVLAKLVLLRYSWPNQGVSSWQESCLDLGNSHPPATSQSAPLHDDLCKKLLCRPSFECQAIDKERCDKRWEEKKSIGV